jgi:hypothetical protein
MSDEEQDATDYKAQYNVLIEEAQAIGMKDLKPIKTNFRDQETGARRCEALAEAIEAHKAKLASGDEEQHHQEPEATEDPPPEPAGKPGGKKKMKASTAKKAAKAAKTAKKTAKAAPKKAAPKEVRTGVVGEFGTREGTKREDLLLFLNGKKGKAIPIKEVIKAVYGNTNMDNIVALKMVMLGISDMIKDKRLNYKLLYEGKGEEATVTFKSGR